MRETFPTPDKNHRDQAVRLTEDCGASVPPLSPNDPLRRASKLPHSVEPDPEPRLGWEASDDPAILCGNVRALATRAYRTLHLASDRTRDALAGEIGELRERVGQVEQQIDRFRRQNGSRLEDLHRWLKNLRRHIEDCVAQLPQAATESIIRDQ